MGFSGLPDVIFDLGGVLLHWDPRAIVRSIFPREPEFNRVHREVFLHPDWLALDRGTLSEEAAIRRFAERTEQPIARMQALMEETRRSLSPMPETIRLLEELAAEDVPLFCLSNMHAANTDFLLAQWPFFRSFRDVVFSALIHLVKPDPAIYQYAAKRFRIEPEHCVFIDDAWPNVSAARVAGWQAIHFESVADCRRELEKLSAIFRSRKRT